MYCKKCGSEMPDGSRFCARCGAVVGESVEAGREGFSEDAKSSDSSVVEVKQKRGKVKLWVGIAVVVVAVVICVAVGVGAYQAHQEEVARQEAQAAYEAEQAARDHGYFPSVSVSHKDGAAADIIAFDYTWAPFTGPSGGRGVFVDLGVGLSELPGRVAGESR